MINKVIFFVNSQFCKRDFDRLGIETLKNNGFEVEVWEFTPFLYPDVFRSYKASDSVDYEGHRLFMTKAEALKAIFGLSSNCFIVIMFGYYLVSYPIYRAVSKKKLRYGLVTALAIPAVPAKKDKPQKRVFRERIRRLTPARISNKLASLVSRHRINYLINRIPFSYLGIRPASFNLAGGKKSATAYNYPFGKKTETLWLHAFDYDIYLRERVKPFDRNSDIAVFLDDYLPFHPDFIYTGEASPVSPEKYYPLLCQFFDFIENRFNVRIVIASHPRAQYENHPDYFDGRIVIRGKTAELIKKSKFVVCHHSTAISYAVLFHKPLFFMTTDQVKCSYEGFTVDAMAALFRKRVINLNDPIGSKINWDQELIINENDYLAYKNDYIKKTGSPDLPFWQIFADRIKQIGVQEVRS